MEEFFLSQGTTFETPRELKNHHTEIVQQWETDIIPTCFHYASSLKSDLDEDESTNGKFSKIILVCIIQSNLYN